MTSYTDKMHKVLNENYKKVQPNGITFADLGYSTANLNFFVTSSVTHSLTLSSGKGGSEGTGLMNKLISLSSEGKYSIIDSVIEKASKGELTKKVDASKERAAALAKLKAASSSNPSVSSSSSKLQATKEFEDMMKEMKKNEVIAVSTTSQPFDIIEELDEEQALEIIEKEERKTDSEIQIISSEAAEEEAADKKLKLKIEEPDHTFAKSKVYNSTCHTWFIVKDKGVDINWRKPLLQKSQITSKV